MILPGTIANLEDFLTRLLDHLPGGIYFVDRDRRITYWNQGAAKISGFSPEKILNKRCQDNLLQHIDNQGKALCLDGCPLEQTLQNGRPRGADVYLHHRDGHRVPVSVRVEPICDHQGEIIGAVELFTDTTSKETLLERIQELERISFLDPLTNLANRRFLDLTIESRLHEMQRYGWPLGVILMDVDNFKQVNDTYGHDVGDKVLATLANTFVSNTRSFDVCGRWGGEEFVSVVVNVSAYDLLAIANRLRVMGANSQVAVPGGMLQVTISTGANLARPSDFPQTLMKRAYELLYESKKAGRNRVTIDQLPGREEFHPPLAYPRPGRVIH
jgi:diguanylate cyclase (GGDEF)-like protein/PAS domain S-box-containing protein